MCMHGVFFNNNKRLALLEFLANTCMQCAEVCTVPCLKRVLFLLCFHSIICRFSTHVFVYRYPGDWSSQCWSLCFKGDAISTSTCWCSIIKLHEHREDRQHPEQNGSLNPRRVITA